MELKVIEAIGYANACGIKITKFDIAEKLWPSNSRASQGVMISRLINNKIKFIKLEWIKIIIEMTGVDGNFILGLEAMPKFNKEV